MADPQFVNALGHVIPLGVLQLFVREEDRRSTIAQYLADENAIVDAVVPGDQRSCRELSYRTRISTAGSVYWGIKLHQSNFSLSPIPNVDLPIPLPEWAICVDHVGSVKGSWDMVNRLVPLNNAHDAYQRSTDMALLGDFIEQHVFRVHLFGVPPASAHHLLVVLRNFKPDQYLLLKTHPALEDSIGECTLFREMFGLLMAMKGRDRQGFDDIIDGIHAELNCPNWVFDAVQNLYVHLVLRVNRGTGSLFDLVVGLLSEDLHCGNGDGENCLRTRRNSQNHLIEDYCGAEAGIPEALCAALSAAIKMTPSLAGHFVDLDTMRSAPFEQAEACGIADAIKSAVQRYKHSSQEATAAATAAALYLCDQPIIFPDPRVGRNVKKTPHFARLLKLYTDQQRDAENAGVQAAKAVQQQQPPQPLVAGNMFGINDVSNIVSLIEPRLICTLHQAMFVAGELQHLELHYDAREVNLRV